MSRSGSPAVSVSVVLLLGASSFAASVRAQGAAGAYPASAPLPVATVAAPAGPPPAGPPPAGPPPASGATAPGTATPAAAPPGYAPGYPYGYGYPPPGYWQKPPSELKSTWYGWQTLIADGASIAMILGGSASIGRDGAPAVLLVGVSGYLLAPPIIHWGHRNVGAGFASLGLRGGGALVGIVGALFTWGQTSSPGVVLMFAGGACMIAAIPLDAALFAYEEPREDHVALGVFHHLGVAPAFGPGPFAHAADLGHGLPLAPPSTAGMHGGLELHGQF